MQKFLLNLAGLGLLTAVLFFSSCDPDDPIIDNPLGPAIQFLSDTDILTGDADLTVGESFSVKIKLDKGDNPLQSVGITEDGVKLETSRFTIDAGAITSNNPFLVTGTDVDGVSYLITINAGTHTVGDFNVYKFTVTDTGAETAFKDIAITTTALPGTPISMTISGVLLNQAGPSNTGGLDLDAGAGTGSLNASAEIRDLGIDCTLTGENWRAQFGTVNGAVMVRVDVTQLENFSFDNVDKTEVIQSAYDTGIALSDGVSQTPACVETAVTDVSGSIVVGDMFVVYANSIYYLVKVDEINTVANSNGDNYMFSIKY